MTTASARAVSTGRALSRVAYFASKYPAPSHTFIRREVDELRRRGVLVETFSLRSPLPEERQSERDRRAFGETCYLRPARPRRTLAAHLQGLCAAPARYVATLCEAFRHRVPGLVAFLGASRAFRDAIVLAMELRRRRHEHLHTHFANDGGTVAYLATRYLGAGLSLTFHGTSEFDYPSILLLSAKIEAAAFVACVSHFGRAQAMRVVDPGQWPKLLVVRCGVELDRRPARLRRGEGSRLRLLTVGRLSPEKGQAGLIEAFRIAVDRGARAELRIVGAGRERPRLEREIDKRALGPLCALLDRQSEAAVLEEIAQSDVFVLSSLMEGLPVVLMEAMSLGVPVIAPRVAGIPELVEDGATGLLFTPGDWDELAERILRLARSPELRSRLAAAGRAHVEARFDIRQTVEPLQQALATRARAGVRGEGEADARRPLESLVP